MIQDWLHRVAHLLGWNHGTIDSRWVCGKLVVFFGTSPNRVGRKSPVRASKPLDF